MYFKRIRNRKQMKWTGKLLINLYELKIFNVIDRYNVKVERIVLWMNHCDVRLI